MNSFLDRAGSFFRANFSLGQGSFVWFFLQFCAVTLLVSAFTGHWFVHSGFSALIGLVGAGFLSKKYPISIEIPRIAWLLSLFLFALLVIPVLQTHGVAASADAATTIAMRVMTDKIPDTYAPYSNVSFTYQIGFPLLANVFQGLWPVAADHQMAWILGAIFAALFVPLLYAFSCEFGFDRRSALLAALLLFGSKLVFENFYWGEYAWLCATVFSMACLVAWKKRNPLVFLFIPAVATLHPAIAFMLGIWAGAFLLLGELDFAFVPRLPIYLLAAIPAIYYNYLPILGNLLAGNGSSPIRLASGIHNLQTLPFWIGTGLTACFLASVFLWLAGRDLKPRNTDLWPAGLFGMSLLAFFALSVMGTILANREIELVLFSVLFWTAANFSAVKWFSRLEKPFFVAILIIGLLSFQFSGSLEKYRGGSKISGNEIQMALAFAEFDSSKSTAVFLSKGGGKMAEISGKIPFDANAANMITTAEVLVIRNEAWEEFELHHRISEEILSSHCSQCVLALGVDYAVIDTNFAGFDLDLEPIRSIGSIRLYKMR